MCKCVCLTICTCLWFFISSLSCHLLVLSNSLFLLYFILLYFLDVCILMKERKKSVDLRVWGSSENLGGIEGGEIIIEIHCIKIFH